MATPQPEIREISIHQVLPIRSHVMWPDKPLSFVQIDGDDHALHLGLFVQDELVSVISVFQTGTEWQFRKFATLKHKQGLGYGSQLLSYVLQRAATEGITRVFCNARKEKVALYSRFGMSPTGESFVREGKHYLIMQIILPPSTQPTTV